MNATASPVFEDNATVLAGYLAAIGYPVVDVDRETKDSVGRVVLVDTNQEQDPARNRRVLDIDVVTEVTGKGKSARTEVRCTIFARKYSTRNRFSGSFTYYCDDLMHLASDVLTQAQIADMVSRYLGLKTENPLFDYDEMCLRADVAEARGHLREREELLAQYQEKKNQK